MSFLKWFVTILCIINGQNNTMEPTLEPTLGPTLGPTMQPTIALCPALQSYVEYIISNVRYTALSINVNWSPYEYLLNENEIILFPNNENVCNIKTINSDLSNKVILIENNINLYNCSQQEWILNLQNKSALAVLIWDQEITNYINPINGNNNLSNPIIPTRVISYDDGFTIYNNINNNNNVTVLFGCFNDTYPINLCISDTGPGSSWDIDGDYQKSATITVNFHPVWFKEQYAGNWGVTKYIYLLPDNENGLKWIIAPSTTSITSFSQIQNNVYNADAYCNILNSSTSDPGSCFDWYIYDYLTDTNGTWKQVNYVASFDGLCDPLDNEIFCLESATPNAISSPQYIGTYHQIHSTVSTWYKIIDPSINADTTGYVITFNCLLQCRYVGWAIVDPSTRLIDAMCVLATFDQWLLIEDQAFARLLPHECDNWFSWQGAGYVDDPYLDLDKKNCGASTQNGTIDLSVFPDKLCLTSDFPYTMIQRFYGEWTKLNVTFDSNPVYQFERLPYTLVYSDFADTYQITRGIPDTEPFAFEASCYLSDDPPSPLNCTNGLTYNQEFWISFSSYFIDSSNNNDNDACFPKLNDNITIVSDTICVNINSSTVLLQRLNESDISGDYIKQEESINGRDYYIKQGLNTQYYLYYNDFYRFWIIDTSTNIDYELDGYNFPFFCREYNKLNPSQCNDWWTSDVDVYFGIEFFCSFSPQYQDVFCSSISPSDFSISDGSCNAIITPNTIKKENKPKGWVGALIIILIILGLIILAFWIYKRNNATTTTVEFVDSPQNEDQISTQIDMANTTKASEANESAINPDNTNADNQNAFMNTDDVPNVADGNKQNWETF